MAKIYPLRGYRQWQTTWSVSYTGKKKRTWFRLVGWQEKAVPVTKMFRGDRGNISVHSTLCPASDRIIKCWILFIPLEKKIWCLCRGWLNNNIIIMNTTSAVSHFVQKRESWSGGEHVKWWKTSGVGSGQRRVKSSCTHRRPSIYGENKEE